MTRARLIFAATLLGAGMTAGTLLAQGNQPPLEPILSGRGSFTPPLRGSAEVNYTNPSLKREKDTVVIKIDVKNMSNAPIARLRIDETWYDKAGATIAGGTGAVNGLLQPGEIKTVTIEMPANKNLASDKMQFTHANGSVNAHKVPKLTDDTKQAPKKK